MRHWFSNSVSLLHYQHFPLHWINPSREKSHYFSHLKTTKRTCFTAGLIGKVLFVCPISLLPLFWIHSIRFSPPPLTKAALSSQCHKWPLLSLLWVTFSISSIWYSYPLFSPRDTCITWLIWPTLVWFFFLIFNSPSCLWICPHFQDLWFGVLPGFVLSLIPIPRPTLISSCLMILNSMSVLSLTAGWSLDTGTPLKAPDPCSTSHLTSLLGC